MREIIVVKKNKRKYTKPSYQKIKVEKKVWAGY